jgi:hypothetical protein
MKCMDRQKHGNMTTLLNDIHFPPTCLLFICQTTRRHFPKSVILMFAVVKISYLITCPLSMEEPGYSETLVRIVTYISSARQPLGKHLFPQQQILRKGFPWQQIHVLLCWVFCIRFARGYERRAACQRNEREEDSYERGLDLYWRRIS